MANKERKFVKALKPENLERREILAEVGRAIVNLSEIENWISAIFHDYCHPLLTSESMPVFNEQGSFEKKLNLTNLIVHLQAEEQHKRKWDTIIGGLDEHRRTRNFIAHYGLVLDRLAVAGRRRTCSLPGSSLTNLEKEQRIFFV